ncbi:MAG: acylphosphatase [Cyanobacteria bacterium P01_G01_bin.4]
MSDSALTQAHVFVSGTVQGVAYRAYTRQQAMELGVAGWVRNLRDSRVEAVFEGPSVVVEQMVQWCHSGSPSAVVTHVETTYGSPEGLQGFEVRYSQ